jgi:hypothetical protein
VTYFILQGKDSIGDPIWVHNADEKLTTKFRSFGHRYETAAAATKAAGKLRTLGYQKFAVIERA